MSTPQGPDRYGADRDADHAGPPTWGTPPPGGWGGTDAGPPTGAWDERWDDEPYRPEPARGSVEDSGGYVGRRRAEDREPAPWGDEAAARPGGADPWSDTGETVAVARDGGYGDTGYADDGYAGHDFTPGDEPWAPREAVKTPWRGPGGLGARAVAGIAVGVVALAVLAVLLFVAPGWLVTTTLDKTALQNGVTQVLTQDYKLQVGAVECPDDVAVETGTEFSCQALVDGEQVTVPGRVTSDEGDYQISRV